MARKSGSNKRRKKSKAKQLDVYEAEDSKNERQSQNGNDDMTNGYEYELPENFEDEEIDEDEAFGSSDEEKYGDVLRRINQRKKKGSQAMSDSDDDDDDDVSDDEASDDGETMQLSDLLKANIEEDDEKHEKLINLVNNKVAKPDEKATVNRNGERTENTAENQFNIQTNSSEQLSLNTLIHSLKDTTSYGALKKQLEGLDKSTTIKESIPKVVEERMERKAAYTDASKHVSRWNPLVQQNRQAKQVSFPLNEVSRIKTTTNSLTANFSSCNDFEAEINNLLKVSELDKDKSIQDKEETMLKHNQVSLEEIEARKGELSKLRALMFYDEVKSKRAKKIKSKMYRKLKKRELNKQKELELEELKRVDPEAARELEEKALLKRAEERMTLRHRNTSRYMRGLVKHNGYKRDNSRQDLEEQLALNQSLKRKIDTIKSDDDSSDDDSGVDADGDPARLAAQAHELVDDIVKDSNQQAQQKGLFALKFMQRGLSKQREQAKANAKQLLKEINEELGDDAESSSDEDVGGNTRKTFQPKAGDEVDTMEHIAKSVSSRTRSRTDKTIKVNVDAKPLVGKELEQTPSESRADDAGTAEDNPWLAGDNDGTSGSKRKCGSPSKASDKKAKQRKVDLTVAFATIDKTTSVKPAQSDLIQRAFATNNELQQQFEAEKVQLEQPKDSEQDKPKAGWGSWTGFGAPVPKKKNVSKPAVNKLSKLPLKDNQLKHVIVSDRVNKKHQKYTVEQVPYPFKTKEQYERSLQHPLGDTWNTLNTFSDNIKPAIKTRAGTVIDPIHFTKVNKYQNSRVKLQKNAKNKQIRLSKMKARKTKL